MNGRTRNAFRFALLAALVVSLVCVVLIVNKRLRREATPRPEGQVVNDRRPAPEPAQQTPRPPKPQPDNRATPDDLAAEFEAVDTPIWAVEIGPIAPGTYRYWFYRDGKSMVDPLNRSSTQDGQSVFLWPPRQPAVPQDAATTSLPASGKPNPRVLAADRAAFLYEGRVEWTLQFIAPFRGEWWGIDEFRPLNAAARTNWEAILADRSLGLLRGVVLDPDRRPIPGARVRVVDMLKYQNTWMGLPQLRTVACDEKGAFRIDRLPLVNAVAVARAPGYGTSKEQYTPVSRPAVASSLEFILSPTRVVAGSVTDEAGRAIAGAKIEATWLGGYLRRTTPRTFTDVTGQYRFDDLTPGRYEFLADAEGFAPAVGKDVRVFFDTADSSPLAVDFVLSAGGVVRGRVVQRIAGGEERGVEGATITLTGTLADAAGRPGRVSHATFSDTSGSDGAFAIAHLPTHAAFRCRAIFGGLVSENQPSILLRTGDEPASIVLYLPRAGQIVGLVVDSDKNPIAGASVFLTSVTPASSQYPRYGPYRAVRAGTDETGRFVLKNIELNARCSVSAEADGFAPASVEGVVVDSLMDAEIILQLWPRHARKLAGRVVEAGTNTPLGNIHLALSPPPAGDARKWQRTSRDDGTFEFPDVPLGLYTIKGRGTVGGTDYIVQPQTLHFVGQNKDRKPIVLQAGPPVAIRGAVLTKHSRKPVKGATVTARVDQFSGGRHATTTGDGTFDLPEIPFGRIEITAYMAGFNQAPRKVIEAKPGDTLDNVELLFPEAGSVAGIVFDEGGSPAPGIRLRLEGMKTESDTEGRFAFPEVEISTELLPPKHRVTTILDGQTLSYGESEPFQLTPEKPHAEVTVRLEPGGSISGRTTYADGEPAPFAVIAFKAEQRDANNGYSQAGMAGEYVIRGLPPDEYEVRAHPPELDPTAPRYKHVEPRRVALKARETVEGIDFVFEEKESEKVGLRGMLVDLKGKPLPGWRVQVDSETGGNVSLAEAKTGHDGTFALHGRGQGHCDLLLSDAGRSLGMFKIAGIEIAEEETETRAEERVFIVPVGATVRGRLVFERSGEPVPRAGVQLQPPKDWKPPPPEDGRCVLLHPPYVGATVESKDEGRFKIESLPITAFNMTIRSPRAQTHTVEGVQTNMHLLTDLGDVPVPAGRTITARLVDARTRQPFRRTIPTESGITIHGSGVVVFGMRASGRRADLGDPGDYQPDANGDLTIRCAPDDLTSLTFTSRAYLPYEVFPVRLDPSGPTNLGTILLDSGHMARGRFVDAATGEARKIIFPQVRGVLASGKPTEYIAFHEGPSGERTDGEGRFVIRRIPGDTVSLTFSTYQYLDAVVEPLALAASGMTDLGDIPLDAGCTVRGKLLGPNGERVDDGEVYIACGENEQYERETDTNTEGEFAIQGLCAGPARLHAAAEKRDNPWIIETDDNDEIELRDYRFTILPDKETRIQVRFPTAVAAPPE